MSHILELLPGAALLSVELLVVGSVAVRVSGALAAPSDSLGVRALVALVVGIAQVVGVMSLLGWVGAIGVLPVAGLHLVVAGVVFLATSSTPAPVAGPSTDRWRLATAVACIAPGAMAVALGLNGRSVEADTVHYHLVNAAQWLNSGNITQLGYAAPGFFTATHPGNGELLAAWLMLPTHMDQLAYLMPALFGMLAVLGVVVAVEEAGSGPACGPGRGRAGLVAADLLLPRPTAETDLTAASGIIAGVGLAVRAMRQPELRRWPWLAGMALGLGLGSKYSATLPFIAVLVFIGATMPKARLQALALTVVGAAAFRWQLVSAKPAGSPRSCLPPDRGAGGKKALCRWQQPPVRRRRLLAEQGHPPRHRGGGRLAG